MVNIKDIRASNAAIRSTFADPVALFVGGTSGIGRSALEQLVKQTVRPTVYLVGRSQKAGDEIVQQAKQTNPQGTYHFISADVSLVANVDKVCEQIKAKEKKLDFMVLSCGYVDFTGIQPTTEGVDVLLMLRYYVRLRFVQQLLPLHPSRIVSVLAGTTEGVLVEDDLTLSKPGNYGILPCANHSSTMTSLSFEHLAKEHPEISFVHMYPGFVKTAVFGRVSSPWIRFLLEWVLLPLVTPFSVSVEESGERTLFHLTSARYPPKEGPAGVPRPDGVPVAQGEGSVYLLGKDGETGAGKPMAGYRERDMGTTIWAHTTDLFKEIQNKSK